MATGRSVIRRLNESGIAPLVARLVLGGLFVYTGLVKVAEPIDFLKQIHEYQVLPESPPILINSVAIGYVGLLALGVAFSLVPAAMWPSVAKIVPENRLGTAYATMFTIQNYGLSAFFWGIGKMVNVTNPRIVEQIQTTRDQLIATGVSMNDIPQRIEELKATGVIPPYNYTWAIFMLVFLGIISIFLAYKLKRADKRQGYGLELPSGQEGVAEGS